MSRKTTFLVWGSDVGSFAGAAVLACGLVLTGGAAARAQSPSGQPALDQQLQAQQKRQAEQQRQAEIESKLRAAPNLADDRLKVRVTGDAVVLEGTVDSEGERDEAVRLAQVKGIAVIDNRLKVESAGLKQTVSDGAVTAQVKAQFLANSTLRRANIDVDTNGAVITLKGTVPSDEVRRLAVDVARSTGGVKRVEDRLQVTPPR